MKPQRDYIAEIIARALGEAPPLMPPATSSMERAAPRVCYPRLVPDPQPAPQRDPVETRNGLRYSIRYPGAPVPEGASISRSGRVYLGTAPIEPCPVCRGQHWMSVQSKRCQSCAGREKRAESARPAPRRGALSDPFERRRLVREICRVAARQPDRPGALAARLARGS